MSLLDSQPPLSLVSEPETKMFPLHKRVSPKYFKEVIFPKIRGHSKLVSSVHWYQIKNNIRGSVEAILQKFDLTREQYLDVSLFPASRVKLNKAERRDVYALFYRYKDYLEAEKLWDDCDKANHVVLSASRSCMSRSVSYSNVLRFSEKKINCERTAERACSGFFCFAFNE